MKLNKVFLAAAFIGLCNGFAFAGNDTKRGQAGAADLLINPWGRSAGWAGANTASIRGIESMNHNVAGLARTDGSEFVFANTNYMVGSGVNISALGFGQRLSETGVMGISVTSVSLGDFLETTYDLPDGTGNTFTPSMVNIGMAYSKSFTDNITGGMLLRIINQSIPNASATGVSFDLGVQYATGPVRIGVSVRNIGPKLQYTGDGFSIKGSPNTSNISGGYTIGQLTDRFEMPALLNIGAAYDISIDDRNKLTLAGNFVSNSFTNDQILGGFEYRWRDFFALRAGYNYNQKLLSTSERTDGNIGPTFGAGIAVPLESLSGGASTTDDLAAPSGKKRMFGVDYSFRTTNPFAGSHTISIFLTL